MNINSNIVIYGAIACVLTVLMGLVTGGLANRGGTEAHRLEMASKLEKMPKTAVYTG